MPKCIVTKCPHKTGQKELYPSVILHPFPGNIEKIKQWLLQTGEDYGDYEVFAEKMSLSEREDTDISVVTTALDEINAACRESPEVGSDKLSDFPEDFNQLELLETHRHLIPTGTQSLWTAESEEEDEEDDDKNEEWFQSQEKKLQQNPKELILFAAENNRLSTLQTVLSNHPNLVNTVDDDHYTPLHRAAYNGHLSIARELIGHGADVHAVTVDDWTPLHSACKWNNASVASFLLQHGADINAQTKGLLTPLHLASGNRGSRQILELLLMNRYIKPHLKNKAGESAFEIARRTDVFHYLFEICDYWITSSYKV